MSGDGIDSIFRWVYYSQIRRLSTIEGCYSSYRTNYLLRPCFPRRRSPPRTGRSRCRAPAGRRRKNGRMSHRPLSAVVLAAGEGTRMRSHRPKPLHRLCGRPMVLHVLDALAELDVDRVAVVVGHRGEWVSKTLIERTPKTLDIELVEQAEQRGTGDAAAVGLTGLPDDAALDEDVEGDVVVLPGDTPLLRPPTLAAGPAPPRHRRGSDAAHRRRPGTDRLRPGRTRAGRSPSSGWSRRPTPPTTSGRSRRSTRRSTASGAACSPRRCAG